MSRTQMIKFKLNNNPLFAKKLNLNDTLFEVRKKLENKLPKGYIFSCSDGTKIELEDEKDFTLEDIVEKNSNNVFTIYLKTKNENILKNNPKEEISEIESENQEEENASMNLSEGPSLLKSSFTIDDNDNNNDHNYSNKNKNNIQKFKIKDLSKFQFLEQKGNLKIYLYPSSNFSDLEKAQSLSFMILGEKGSGKTTFLNGLINSLLGVELEDNYRFKIINEKNEQYHNYNQPNNINYYNIRSIGGYPPVKIIDIPGHGNLEKDREIIDQIKELISDKINSLNSISFVAKSNNYNISLSQKFIFQNILSFLAEDAKNIFNFIFTFWDCGLAKIIEPLKEKSLFKKIIQSYEYSNWYYTFNNSVIFEDNRNNEITKKYWKLSMQSFSDFKIKLNSLPKISLRLSKTVIAKRDFLKDKFQILENKYRTVKNKFEELKNLNKKIIELKQDINDSKNFKKKIKQPNDTKN